MAKPNIEPEVCQRTDGKWWKRDGIKWVGPFETEGAAKQ